MNFHRVRQLLARFLFVESSSIRNFESRTRITILNTLSRVHLSRFKRLVREEKREREGKIYLSRYDGESKNELCDGNSLVYHGEREKEFTLLRIAIH